MKPLYILSALALAFILAGCATPKTFVATNGSRADGTIELSYRYGEFETPVVDSGQTYITAKQRCLAWGYSDAEPFGGQTTSCKEGDCDIHVVTTRYQCLGNPN